MEEKLKKVLEGEGSESESSESVDEELLNKNSENATEELVGEGSESADTSSAEGDSEVSVVAEDESVNASSENVTEESNVNVAEDEGNVDVTEKPNESENVGKNPYEKTFSQEDVDKMVGDTRVKTREKTFNYIFNKYGVKNEEELDELIANAQRYDTFREESEEKEKSWEQERSERDTRLANMSEEIALMKSDIDPERYEDAKLILKGKGLEITLENIQSQLESHPEWKKGEEEEKVEETPTVTTRITTLGNERKPAPSESEEEQAEKIFKMKFR